MLELDVDISAGFVEERYRPRRKFEQNYLGARMVPLPERLGSGWCSHAQQGSKDTSHRLSNQNLVVKWSAQNHVKNSKGDCTSFMGGIRNLLLAFIYPGFDCGSPELQGTLYISW